MSKRKTRKQKIKLGLKRQLIYANRMIIELNKEIDEYIEEQKELNAKVKYYSGYYNPSIYVNYSPMEVKCTLLMYYQIEKIRLVQELKKMGVKVNEISKYIS